jgi:hypothetical protein
MSLDLPTLMVMESFALACAGAVLLFIWLQNQTVSVLRYGDCPTHYGRRRHSSLMLGVMMRHRHGPFSVTVYCHCKRALCGKLRIPTKSAGNSERSRPPVPIEAGRGFR